MRTWTSSDFFPRFRHIHISARHVSSAVYRIGGSCPARRPSPMGSRSVRFLKYFIELGELRRARKLFDEIPEPGIRDWTLLISACVRHGGAAEGVELCARLLRRGRPRPDALALIAGAGACGAAGDLGKAREVHRDAVRLGLLDSELPLGNALIDMYAKCGSPEEARTVFAAMPRLDVISYTSAISALTAFPSQAMQLLRQMNSSGTKPNAVTLSKALSICAGARSLSHGRELHGFAVRTGLAGGDFVAAGLVGLYSKCNAVQKAQNLFERMPHRDQVSWNAMLAGFFSNHLPDEAAGLFQRMKRSDATPSLASWNCMIGGLADCGRPFQSLKLLFAMQETGLKPNLATIASLLPACAALESLRACREVHGLSLRVGHTSQVVVSTALVLAYARSGALELALRVFSAMETKDVVAWNTMIAANSSHGRGEEALAMLAAMAAEGAKPNAVTFLAVLSGCSHCKLVEQGKRVFDSMAGSYGVTPEADHYSCMVDVLARAGRLEEAHRFLRSMPVEPRAAAWGALLAGCRVHRNVELGALAARRLFELEPGNPGNYVLWSNTLVAAGRWTDASAARKMMRERAVEKQPGCSWIQIRNRVFSFVRGDRRNPRSEEIYRFLAEAREGMRGQGLLPLTSSALHDVDEEEKEELLCGHSEKLATAFGIISGEFTVRVFKNLRICEDCHALIKFSAKLAGVFIVVRDSSRFHHFRDGDCSCGDFW